MSRGAAHRDAQDGHSGFWRSSLLRNRQPFVKEAERRDLPAPQLHPARFCQNMRLDWKQSLAMMRRDAHLHPSPNSGLPEAGVAGALGVQLGGLNYTPISVTSRMASSAANAYGTSSPIMATVTIPPSIKNSPCAKLITLLTL